jgi:hypothetical protein
MAQTPNERCGSYPWIANAFEAFDASRPWKNYLDMCKGKCSKSQKIALTHFSLSRAVEITDMLIYVSTGPTERPHFKQFCEGPLLQRMYTALVAARRTPRGLHPKLIFQGTRQPKLARTTYRRPVMCTPLD